MTKLLMLVVICISAVAVAFGQATPTIPHPEFFKSTDGAELYKFYCSNCHGMDAKGRPASPAMRTPSSDLTALTANNGGVFPYDRIVGVIKHGAGSTAAHGPKDMPVWGAIFRSMEPSDTHVDIRIENLVRYLESLQESRGRLGAE